MVVFYHTTVVLCQVLYTYILKKDELNKNKLRNYRPVSNLNPISKMLITLFINRIKSNIAMQSDKKNVNLHTDQDVRNETALVKIVIDVFEDIDR